MGAIFIWFLNLVLLVWDLLIEYELWTGERLFYRWLRRALVFTRTPLSSATETEPHAISCYLLQLSALQQAPRLSSACWVGSSCYEVESWERGFWGAHTELCFTCGGITIVATSCPPYHHHQSSEASLLSFWCPYLGLSHYLQSRLLSEPWSRKRNWALALHTLRFLWF